MQLRGNRARTANAAVLLARRCTLITGVARVDLRVDRAFVFDAKGEGLVGRQLVDAAVEFKRAVRQQQVVLARVDERHLRHTQHGLQVQVRARRFVVRPRPQVGDRRRAVSERQVRLRRERRRMFTMHEEGNQRDGLREMRIDVARRERLIRSERVNGLQVYRARIVGGPE